MSSITSFLIALFLCTTPQASEKSIPPFPTPLGGILIINERSNEPILGRNTPDHHRVDFSLICGKTAYAFYAQSPYPALHYMNKEGGIAWIIDGKGESDTSAYKKEIPDTVKPYYLLGYLGPDNKYYAPQIAPLLSTYSLYPKPMSSDSINQWVSNTLKKQGLSKERNARQKIQDVEILTYLQNLPQRRASQYVVLRFYPKSEQKNINDANAIFLTDEQIKNNTCHLFLGKWTQNKHLSKKERVQYTLKEVKINQWTRVRALSTSKKLLKKHYKLETLSQKNFEKEHLMIKKELGPNTPLIARTSVITSLKDLEKRIKIFHKHQNILRKALPHREDINAHIKDFMRINSTDDATAPLSMSNAFHNNRPMASKGTWEAIDNKKKRARKALKDHPTAEFPKYFKAYGISYKASYPSGLDGYRTLYDLLNKAPVTLFPNNINPLSKKEKTI